MPESVSAAARWARLALTVGLTLWGWAIIKDPTETLVHILTLPIHETGHLVFTPFGEFMHFLGGSLFQLLFPAIFVGYFLYHKDKHAATIPLWFVGVSAADLHPYIKDAPFGELELIGGEHDWAYLLGEMGLTHRAAEIADRVLAFGALCVFAALILGILWLPKAEPSAEA